MKTLYEKLGETYREENGNLVPELELPEQTNYQIGKYGQLYLDYIKNNRAQKEIFEKFDDCWSEYASCAEEAILHTLSNSEYKLLLKH